MLHALPYTAATCGAIALATAWLRESFAMLLTVGYAELFLARVNRLSSRLRGRVLRLL